MLLHRNKSGRLNQATEHAVAVLTQPYSNTRSVAELVLAEAILLLRGIQKKMLKRIVENGSKQQMIPSKSEAKRLV